MCPLQNIIPIAYVFIQMSITMFFDFCLLPSSPSVAGAVGGVPGGVGTRDVPLPSLAPPPSFLLLLPRSLLLPDLCAAGLRPPQHHRSAAAQQVSHSVWPAPGPGSSKIPKFQGAIFFADQELLLAKPHSANHFVSLTFAV